MLHTFVTGANTENKARKYAEATNVVQNLSEQIQALDADSILLDSGTVASGAVFYAKSGASYIYAGTAAPAADAGKYYIGIPGYTYGASSYDALITLDASDSINLNPVVVGNHMDALINMTGADDRAVMLLQAQCGSLKDVGGLDESDLTRSIAFNVTGSDGTYSAEVQFNYSASIVYTDDEGNSNLYPFSDAEQASASIGAVSAPADGGSAASVFLFFNAYYSPYMTGEDIAINNSTGLDINVFLVNTSTDPMPGTYGSARINYKYQSFSGSDPVNKLVFTNLPAGKVSYTAWQDAFIYKTNVDISGYLVEAKPRNRKFAVDIKLFEEGSGFSGDVIADFTSTRLNY
ncbi:MAG: hypothetical protein VB064_08675 [Oscillospiraceae bacterium]|nr:hypothetical protein [Oscillospiraceae bacterium]